VQGVTPRRCIAVAKGRSVEVSCIFSIVARNDLQKLSSEFDSGGPNGDGVSFDALLRENEGKVHFND